MQKVKKIVLWLGYIVAAMLFVMSIIESFVSGSWTMILIGTVMAILFVIGWRFLANLARV